MNTVKKLPSAMPGWSPRCAQFPYMAQEFTQEQIDAIVAKAVDKALADRQAKIDAAADKKVDVYLPTRKPPPLRRIWRFRSA